MINVGVPLADCGSVGHNIFGRGFTQIFTEQNPSSDRVQRLIKIVQNIVYIFDPY
jgi:hypothetical protein